MKTAAIYARVSSEQQKEQNTIASQTKALLDYAQANQYTIPPEWIFEDAGYSGSVLMRPGLERLRDLIATGVLNCATSTRRIGWPASMPIRYSWSMNGSGRALVQIVASKQKATYCFR